MLLIFMVTVYSIGVEIKDRTAHEWLHMGNNSIWISLAGKLLPHTAIFFLMGILYNVYLYGFLHFPCNSGILPMLLATLCLVLASQGMGILMIGTLPTLRLGLSFASLWGVLSFSMCGLSFPAMAMHPVLQRFSKLISLAPLLPHLCRPSLEWLSDDLLMDELCGAAYFYDASFPRCPQAERSIDIL